MFGSFYSFLLAHFVRLFGSFHSLGWLNLFALFGSFHSLFAESANDLRGDLDFGDEVFGG
jgi:hypothetical protein